MVWNAKGKSTAKEGLNSSGVAMVAACPSSLIMALPINRISLGSSFKKSTTVELSPLNSTLLVRVWPLGGVSRLNLIS